MTRRLLLLRSSLLLRLLLLSLTLLLLRLSLTLLLGGKMGSLLVRT